MNIVRTYISMHQKFSDVYPEIPSNVLFFKNRTNVGGTHSEITNPNRHSLIIEPNTPVIIGKANQHSNVIPVHAKVNIKDIHTKIMKLIKKGEKVKLMCTPESYKKAVNALELAGFNVYNDVFCLFDECEKLAKDVHYREYIILPLDYFFKFKNKAFLSATALEPSDPRFKMFTKHYLIPTEPIAVPIQLYPTNNTLFTLQDLMKVRTEPHFIFLNSVYSIVGFISFMKLDEDEVAIFVSSKSCERLKLQGFKNVYDRIDETKFKKYTFFTSRYFSAVDINIDYDINIYLVTDVLLASFTVIDPKTDAVQIHGRFRNKAYKRNLFAVFSVDKDIDVLNKKELALQESIILAVHNIIQAYKLTLNSDESKHDLYHMFKSYPFGKFIDHKGCINHLIRDNIYYLNAVKYLYTDKQLVIDAYKEAKAQETDLNYFQIDYMRYCKHNLHMENMSLVSPNYKFKDFAVNFVATMKSIDRDLLINPDNEMLIEERENMKMNFPEMVKIYEYENANNLSFLPECGSKKEMSYLMIEYGLRNLSKNNPLIEDLKIEFPIGDFIPEEKLVDRFVSVLERHDAKLFANKQNLERFLLLSSRTTRNKKKGYIIKDYKV